ncbi:MAG: type VI secretion system tip protein VgrG, partial [Bryobacteraceae bacterium]|nr:type VI secretion system tip protein VgrG [Bryobacteraceae bacterium]
MADIRRIAELPIETPLGDDAVTLVSIDGTEKISDLFHFTLKLASEDANIDLNRLVGKALNFGIRTRDREEVRWWNGYVSRARALPETDQVYFYEVEVVPWLWFLTKTSDCVVHQEKKVLDIVKDVFRKYSFQDFEDRTEDQYTKWEYCTQYRESAFSFVSRLMESEGIFYFFRHEKGKHTLVMADRSTVFQPSKHQETVKMRHAFGAGARRSEDMILKWEFHSAFRSGKYTHWDYNFLKPENPLRAEMPAKRKKEAASKYEIYDYPGEYEEHQDGDDWARLRMESEELENEVCRAESDVRALSAGCKFNFTDHDRRDQNKTYYITEIRHEAKEAGLYGGSKEGPAEYKNTFSCLDVNVQYRPERKTPKHIMRGVQTATVVGPKGEEIYTDEYGRVKVQFHWDRLGKRDQDSSCWMRVSHDLAGKGFGAVFLPRVGQEVLVHFIEGDPDRPIITGRVYNASQTHPWDLPKNKNWSGVRTRSTKGGGAENYNEIRFDDTKGAEVFAMHAERDMQISVERNMLIQVDKDCHEAILGERRQSIQKNNSVTIEGNHAEKISGSKSTKVNGSVELDADGNVTVKAGGNITIKAGGSMTIEAGTSITIKAGSGRITVGAMGVTADGSMVMLNCGSPDMSMPNMPLGKSPSAPELIEKLKAGALGGAGGAAAG